MTNVISSGTVLTGNLGVSPGNAISGFPPGIVTGAIHSGNAVAGTAQADALTAANYLAGEACTANLTGTDLGGLTLLPGVYCFSSSAQLTGLLTLNASANPAGVFVFKIGSTLTTASNASITVIGGSSCNVFFQVGTSATIGTGTTFSGSIFASASITVATGASVSGGLYALNGAVTLDANPVTSCPGIQTGTLQVCKVAGVSALAGASFAFTIGSTPPTTLSVIAGPAPAGNCSAPVTLPAQNVLITETIPANTTLASVSTTPSAGLLVNSNLAAGTATVRIDPNIQTVATFINTSPPPPTTGLLQICKIAGNGVVLGTPFIYSLNVGGTALPGVSVPAGSAPGNCSAPQTVPAGQALITEALPSGTNLTAVSTLPGSGLLVASNLPAGTATVTVNIGALTIATFTNTVTPATGFIQICNVGGSGVPAATPFSYNVAGTPVIVASGAGPAGNCGAPIPVPIGDQLIIETLPIGVGLVTVNTGPSGSLLVASNLAAGTANVTVNAGATTVVTFSNALIPPATGFIQVCAIAGAGVPVGTSFTFNLAGNPVTVVTVAAGAAPGGNCSPALVIPSGQLAIGATLPVGASVTSITTLPLSNSLIAANLAAGQATVAIAPGEQTIVVFALTVLPTNGSVQVCKVAGSGIPPGTLFSFNVGGNPITVAAGPAPGGTCSTPVILPPGQILITETLPPGVALTSVTTLPPGSLVSSNLATGTAVVNVTVGIQTTATFLNAVIPAPTTGFLQICKVAGAGVPVGTNFSFLVAGNPVVVSAGSAPGGNCGTPVVVPAGAVAISETGSGGSVLTGITTLPPDLLVSSNLPAGTATVTVNAGGQTIATFLNTIPASTGLLKICKIAGVGVPVGGMFTFNVAGVSLRVAAGAGPGGTCSPPLAFPIGLAVSVSEAVSSGTVLSALSVVPSNAGIVNLAGRSVVATIGAGETAVLFTNTAGGSGLLKVCKTGGPGIATGTLFGFTIGAASFNVPSGYCVNRGTFPVGTVVTITESPNPTTVLSNIVVLPAPLAVSINVPGRTAATTIGVGVTEVTFTNVRLAP